MTHFFYFIRMNIFIGNLNYKVDEYDLQGIFEEYGVVKSAKVITDRMTGRSKGFGFVEMASEDDGKKAVEELNGGELEGRNIVVNEAKPRTEENKSFSRGSRSFQRN